MCVRVRACVYGDTDPDGDVYEGEFRFGRREGRGKYMYSKGECYEVCVCERERERGVCV